ncbi:MAG: hypothetical protein C4521_10135 [Actinobacteria bacterium]|nr:MAG: hypothetical protein C4521_10135 [Actinomycetota bacterium]
MKTRHARPLPAVRRREEGRVNDQEYLKKYESQLDLGSTKWIFGLDEHEDHAGQSLATRNHEVIQKWAEERNATPATIPGTEHEGRPGVLRFDFPGYGGRELKHISWEDWFRSFDDRELVFLYQEHLKSGNQSNFFKMNSPHREAA